MSGKGYWKNRLPFLLVNGFCMAALTVFLLVNGNSADSIALILFQDFNLLDTLTILSVLTMLGGGSDVY